MKPEIAILHQDRCLLFADKPPRMLTTPAPRGQALDKGKPLLSHLLAAGHHIFAVHRLDYETSGVVMFAKDQATRDRVMGAFKDKTVSKTYEALVQGTMRDKSGILDFPIRDLGATARIDTQGEEARTRYEVLETFKSATLLRLFPETGRHNQIRLHLAHIGRPIVGERKFARGRDAVLRHRRVLLHATSLKFKPDHLEHPLRIRSRHWPDFQEYVAALRAGRDPSPAHENRQD